MVTISVKRSEGGPLVVYEIRSGAFPEPIEVPAIDEKLEAQMKANCATEEEIDALVDELNLRGAASVSFLVRRNNLLVF